MTVSRHFRRFVISAIAAAILAVTALAAPASATVQSTYGWVLVTGPDAGNYSYNTQSGVGLQH